MKHLNNWKVFNENNNNQNKILTEIVERIGRDKLTDINFGDSLTPYVHFIFNNKPFSISLTDRIGMNGDYSNISVIVEVEGITESLGYFNMNEVDEVVNLILNY
jgi:hypothetical protein